MGIRGILAPASSSQDLAPQTDFRWGTSSERIESESDVRGICFCQRKRDDTESFASFERYAVLV